MSHGTAISVVIVEDHELMAGALDSALSAHPRLHVAGHAVTAADGYELISRTRPSVVVVDFDLPDASGPEVARVVLEDFDGIEVVMLAGLSDGATLAEALDSGCSGYVEKKSHLDELIATIEAVAAGHVRVPRHMMDQLVEHLRPSAPTIGHDLTVREREVLGMLADGMSTIELVEKLVVSVHTVRNHVRNILTKLHAGSRLEAVAIATRAGLLRGDA